MPNLPSAFNSSKYDDINNFKPIPKATVVAQIIKSELKDVKDNAAHKYYQLDFKVIQGEHVGRMFFVRLNLIHSSERAVEMSNKELATITRACGLVFVNSTEELHMKPMEVDLDVKPATPNQIAFQIVRMYRPIGTGAVIVGAEAAGPIAPKTKKAPWEEDEEDEDEDGGETTAAEPSAETSAEPTAETIAEPAEEPVTAEGDKGLPFTEDEEDD